ncbi:MAG TPA: tagaturonate epimerase family protein [Clostridiales bacterium]|nr:tagaturonate epimerase family protein [Clostridiales bacterium]
MNWEKFCFKLQDIAPGNNQSHIPNSNDEILTNIRLEAKRNFTEYGIYPDSIHNQNGIWYFLIRDNERKSLVIHGKDNNFNDFEGEEMTVNGKPTKVCSLGNNNCDIIRHIFPFTNPSNHKGRNITIGLGDRLGVASAGHIRLVKDKPVFPVLAQQSIRELNLTGRTYRDVLSAASWDVFQEGYTKGFGADGDHLKTYDEVKMALDNGFTMITLDCSEHINNQVASYSSDEVKQKYSEIELGERNRLESTYLNKSFKLNDVVAISFDQDSFRRIVLIYLKAIKYTLEIYNEVIKNCGRSIDFEMSIDETLTPTTPESHYFVASELIAGGVEITSLAPRFCGEFQKGIDYRGYIKQFTEEFELHVKIAQHFGYKVSVHSGSDKFSVFPIIGEKTGGKYHLKTAGTNWLEAVRVISAENPSLYRKIHKFALKHLNEAKKYYHISADPSNIPDIDMLKDHELPSLFDQDDSRQVIHITYGLILQAKDSEGKPLFKNDIYSTLFNYEEEYCKSLEKHIGKHLNLLGIRTDVL